jgi:hypothetical protein
MGADHVIQRSTIKLIAEQVLARAWAEGRVRLKHVWEGRPLQQWPKPREEPFKGLAKSCDLPIRIPAATLLPSSVLTSRLQP